MHRLPPQVLDAGGVVMATILQNIASAFWLALGVYALYLLRKWDKNFNELYEELKWEVE